MEIKLHVASEEQEKERLLVVCRQLCVNINDETDIGAHLPEVAGTRGSRGEPITIGTIVLSIITSGAITALCNVLKAYFSRDSSLKISLKRADGNEIKLEARDLSPENQQATIKRAWKFLE